MARDGSGSRSRGGVRAGVMADAFRSQLWPLPTLAVVLSTALGVLLPALDARVDDNLSDSVENWLFGGGPEAARSVLGAIAGSLVTLTSLTFSLTVVTLQLASGQFSPRLLRTFNQDRFVHVTLSLFLATFVYSLTVLRTVRTGGDTRVAVVPQVSVTVAFVLAVASVLGLVLFLAHLAREIRVETMLRRVQSEARATVARSLTDREGPASTVALPTPPARAEPLLAGSSGFLTSVDHEALVAAASEAGMVVLLERPLGSSLVAGTPVGWMWAADGRRPDEDSVDRLQQRCAASMSTGHEPTSARDVAFGLKQLTDVAAKALSPGINDPRTAIHALGHSSALLCLLAGKVLGATVDCDADGHERLYWDQIDFAGLLDLAVSAPRRYGAADPDVLARLYALLAEVAWSAADPAHRRAVAGQLARLRNTAGAQDLDADERDRLAVLAETVEAALQGRHCSPARAVVV